MAYAEMLDRYRVLADKAAHTLLTNQEKEEMCGLEEAMDHTLEMEQATRG